MSLFEPSIVARDLSSILSQPAADSEPPFPDDRLQLLLEAGMLNCCPHGDFLSLMPSVERAEPASSEGATWLRRVLGF